MLPSCLTSWDQTRRDMSTMLWLPKIQTFTHGYQGCLDPDVFQNVMAKLVNDMLHKYFA
jgi:hypothetical protein